MSCGNCLPTQRELQELIEKVSIEAKQYAVDNQKMVMVYRMDDGTVAFMEAEAGRSLGIVAVKYLSQLQ